MLIGTALVLTGVGAPLGAALITYGGYVSLTGTSVDLANDAYKGEWSNEKFLTKTVLEILPTSKFGGKFFKYLEAENATEVLNAGTIVADRTLDLFRDTKVGPYREN